MIKMFILFWNNLVNYMLYNVKEGLINYIYDKKRVSNAKLANC